MKTNLHRWFSANQTILTNTGSLVGTTVVTSGLGFIYWWLAARLFPSAAVGLASAAISAMMLLGYLGMLGLGTLLIGELPHQRRTGGSFVTASLLVAGTASLFLAFSFAAFAPRLSVELEPLTQSFGSTTLFAAGVVLTAVTLVFDQALIGLLRGGLQLWRNSLFALAKLIALWAAGVWFADKLGLTIYATWVVGSLVSLAVLTAVISSKGIQILHRPRWGLLRCLGRTALGHHAINLALQAPGLALPILVTALLSAAVNAGFFAAWMIASFAFIIPNHLTTVLYAVGVQEVEILAQKLRISLKLSFIIGLLASSAIFVSASLILGLFGTNYANQADWCLRILGVGVFPLLVKYHYVAIRRIQRQIESTAVFMAAGGALELTLAGIGGTLAGLVGLSIGWLIAVCIEAVLMSPTVYRMAISKAIVPDQDGSQVGPPASSMVPGYIE